MTITTEKGSAVFSLATPYLEQGITSETVAQGEALRISIKVYAEGGENTMHHHVDQDHSFVVLEGEATFRLESDDNVRVIRQYEGVMLPKGANYWFENSGGRNLVMLRTAASIPGETGTYYPDGTPKSGTLAPEREPYIYLERIEAQGPGFGASS